MKSTSLLFLLLVTGTSLATAQLTPKEAGLHAITPTSVQAPLEFLASDWTTGRKTATQGEFMAGDYIASLFKTIGLKPGGSSSRLNTSYFQNINFIQTRPGDRQSLSLIRKSGNSRSQVDLGYRVDYNVQPGSVSVEAEAPVVFVGYGISDKKLKHNDFKGLDVKGCILIRISGFPGSGNPESANFKRFNGADQSAVRQIQANRDQEALRRGAIGIIEIRQGTTDFLPAATNIFRYNTDTYEGDVPMTAQPDYRTSLQEKPQPALIRISLTNRAVNMLTEDCGIDFREYEKRSAEENLKPGMMPGDRYIRLVSSVDSRIVRGRNVIGVLEGQETDKCIVLGAHYDHMGQIGGYIYNGSDDDASGVAGIINIARAMLATGVKPITTVVFCAWTAEEEGLLGSSYFTAHPYMKDMRCYMNYDMISRTAPDDSTGRKCDFNYSSGLPLLKELTEKHIQEYGLKLDMAYQTSAKPVGGSDFSSFSRIDVPIFLIHGKFTPDYHQFTDHSDKAVLPYMTDIIRLGYLNIYELANKHW